MTVVSALSPLSLACFFYDSGELVRPARAFFFKPGTEDRVVVYTEATLGIPYDQPVLSGGSGRIPPIYVGTEPYRVRIYDNYGALIEDIDYLPGAVEADAGDGGGDAPPPGSLLQTGDFIYTYANSFVPRPGCVRANGALIGPPGFATASYVIERLNADTHDLFVWLWGQDNAAPNNVLAVIPSKGTTAEDDWVLNKAITLPDYRARALVCLDGIGNVATNRMADVPVTGYFTFPGSSGGLATSTMTAAQMPSHAHSMDDALTGLTVNANITGLTVNDPGHLHATVGFIGGGTAATTSGGVLQYANTTTLGAATGITLSDPSHGHGITDPRHRHTLAVAGSSQAMPTMPPFALALVYIKL